MAACEQCGKPVTGKKAYARFCGVCRPSTGRRVARDRGAESRAEVERDLVARVGSRIGVDLAALSRLSGPEREQALVELREVDRAFKRNPLLGYRPHEQQQRFHSAIGLDLRAFFGGNRAGKTTCAVLDSLIQSVDDDWLPDHLKAYRRFQAPFYCRVVTPDLSNTLEGVVLQKIREWCPAEQLRGGSFERGYDKVLRVLHFRNGSWWQFFSNDQELNKLGGAALHRVVYDEEPRADIRRECLMRLIDYGGDEIFAMTPLMGLSYTFEEIYEPWRRKRIPDGSVTIADMDDNPHLDRREIERVLSGFSREERQARKSGRFVAFEGLVYDEWSPERHVEPVTGLPDGDVYVGIDPGIRHMCGVVWTVLDVSDRLVVFEELPAQGLTIREVCRLIGEVNAKWDVKPRWYVIDPASRNKNNQTGRSDQQEFSEHGVPTIPGQNAVTAGINRVKERLQADRLVVAPNCRELRREFDRYRWSKPRRVEGDPKEAPVKTQDHLLDALRYVCMARPLRPEVGSRTESLTMRDRLLRAALEKHGLGSKEVVGSPSGPGMFV